MKNLSQTKINDDFMSIDVVLRDLNADRSRLLEAYIFSLQNVTSYYLAPFQAISTFASYTDTDVVKQLKGLLTHSNEFVRKGAQSTCHKIGVPMEEVIQHYICNLSDSTLYSVEFISTHGTEAQKQRAREQIIKIRERTPTTISTYEDDYDDFQGFDSNEMYPIYGAKLVEEKNPELYQLEKAIKLLEQPIKSLP